MEINIVLRNAVAMNNMATVLLKVRSYDDALRVLNDALFSLRFYSLQQQQQAEHYQQQEQQQKEYVADDYECQNLIEHDVKIRSMFVSAQVKVCTAQTSCSYDKIVLEQIFVSEIDYLDKVESIVSIRESNSLTVHPICIDKIDFTNRASNDIGFECGIILYNCGIAHCCMWLEKYVVNGKFDLPVTATHHYHFDSAVRLLMMGHKLCSEAIVDLIKDDTTSSLLTNFIHVEAGILSILVILLGASSDSMHMGPAIYFQSQLHNLVSSANETATNHRLLFGGIMTKSASCA